MDPEEQQLLPPDFSDVCVFPLICHIKKDVSENIDTALSWEQLTASDINFAIVRPLVYKYARPRNIAAVYACLVVRSHFIQVADEDLANANIMASRAMMCEILAMKLVRTFASNKLELAAVLTTSWNPMAGAPREVVKTVMETLGGNEEDLDDPTSALEVAIATKAKSFLASAAVQAVVNDIYAGRIVFSTVSNRSVLADNYKPRPVEVYDGRKAPFLDHYRLRVPKYRSVLEFFNFAILMLTFCLCLSAQDPVRFGRWEGVFVVFALAFLLDEYAQAREHGWNIYIASMWNVFDTAFLAVFLAYLGLRIKGLVSGDAHYSELAFDILACGACILFPRLAFFIIKDNMVILALRGMIAEFAFFMCVAAVCFSGLLFTLWTLADKNQWPLRKITWLMVQIWFGNTYLSFQQAESFHKIFGPILMTIFAALSNTLLVTILISILSNTFTRIDANANQEYLFQYSISTIEGVKCDALFSYQPPFNLFAYVLLLPLSWVVSPRTLHSANVFLIRLTSFPILVIIRIYEHYFEEGSKTRAIGKDRASLLYNSLPRNLKSMPLVEALIGGHANTVYDVIFDIELSDEQERALYEDFSDADDEDHLALRSAASRENTRRRSRPQSSQRPPSTSHHSTPPRSPRRRPKESLTTDGGQAPQVPLLRMPRSPLARLFSGPRIVTSQADTAVSPVSPMTDETLAGVRRLETVLEGIRELPVQRLKDEMKELQDRQARIENLLMTLTRGMRNEPSVHPASRHNSTF